MKISEKDKQLRLKLSEVLPLLNERQRRILVASEARDYGKGGVLALSRITGLCRYGSDSRPTESLIKRHTTSWCRNNDNESTR